MDTNTRQSESFLCKYKTVIFAVLLAAITFGTYARVIGYDFINFDDDNYVSGNTTVQKGFSPEGFKYAFSITETKRAYWHPLTWLSHMMDCQLFGLNAGMHHLSSVLLHILTSLLLFWVFHLMTGVFMQSALIATLFALHPLSVDSVAWIAERKNVLSTLFWMLVMVAYTSYSRKPGTIKYLIVFTLFLLGLLAKPMLVTLPCVLLLMDFWPMNRMGLLPAQDTATNFPQTSLRRLIFEKVPFLIFSFFAIFISSHSLKVLAAYVSTARVPMTLRIENAIVSYVKYIGKIIWPVDLAVYYPFPASIPAWQVISAAIVLVALSALVVSQIKSRPWFSIGWFWFLGTLFPVSGLVQGGLWPEMADRWAYIPQIGIYIMIAWPVSNLAGAATTLGKITVMVAGALLLALSATTWTQIGSWENSKVLFYHALAATGENSIVHRNLGQAFHQEKDYDTAIEHFRKGIQINPRYHENHVGLANALLENKATMEAIRHYQIAIKLNPKDTYSYVQLGMLLKDEGNPREALKYLNKSLAIDPENVGARHNLGLCIAETGNFEEAEKEVLKALSLEDNKSEGFYNVGAFYGKYHKQDQAIDFLKKALKENSEHLEANYNLGLIAAGENKTKAAEQYFLTTLTTNPEHIDALNNLGLLYSKTGRPYKAIEQFEKALELDAQDCLVRLNLANTLVQSDRVSEASRQFAKILEFDPKHDGARIGYQQTSQFLAAIDSEIASTEALLKFDPESPALLVTLGDLYLNRGEVKRGIEYYRKVQALYPNHAGILNKIGAAFNRIENYDQAILYFKKAIALVPEKPEGYYNVACMYSKLDKTDQALEWIERAVKKGYDKWELLKTDPDLENFRKTPAYNSLIDGK